MKKIPALLLFTLLLALCAEAQNQREIFTKNAHQLSDQYKFAEAAAEIGRAIELEPTDPKLYLMRARYHWMAKNSEQLLADVEKAAVLSPTDKDVLYGAALLLRQSRNYQPALKIIEQLFALGSPDVSAWQLKVQIKTHLEDFVGAFEDVTEAVGLFPDNTYLRQNQANLVRLMGDADKSLEMYEKLIASSEKRLNKAKDPNQIAALKWSLVQFLFGAARVHLDRRNLETAQSLMEKAVALSPGKQTYYQRARHYIMNKMPAEALPDLNKAIELDKDQDIMLFIDRGDAFYALGKYAEAIGDYEQVIKLDEAQMKEPMQRRINLARQKMAANNVQPK